jgi:predicted RNase H-like HicB family nuclease
MIPLAGMLFNVVAGLVVDKAQDLAQEHVEKMIDDILPDKAKKELDKIVKEDPAHTFDNAKDALMGAVEGKLPINLKDGTLKPIELTVKVKFDPNTQKIEVIT